MNKSKQSKIKTDCIFFCIGFTDKILQMKGFLHTIMVLVTL